MAHPIVRGPLLLRGTHLRFKIPGAVHPKAPFPIKPSQPHLTVRCLASKKGDGDDEKSWSEIAGEAADIGK
jgi:hypothetical protein